MKTKNNNLRTLEEFKEKNYGRLGSKKRDELEAGYEAFKVGASIHFREIVCKQKYWKNILNI